MVRLGRLARAMGCGGWGATQEPHLDVAHARRDDQECPGSGSPQGQRGALPILLPVLHLLGPSLGRQESQASYSVRSRTPGSAPAWSFQMHCSSSRSFRSRDHLSPLSSAAALCRDSLSDFREDRDTWLMKLTWSQGVALGESRRRSSMPMCTLTCDAVRGFMRPWAWASYLSRSGFL